MKQSIRLSILIFLCISCAVSKGDRSKGLDVLKSNFIILKSVPGGSRAHIIEVSKRGVLRYYVAEVKNFEADGDVELLKDNNYKEKNIELTAKQVNQINDILGNKDLEYMDSSTVKDSWQYYVYIDGRKTAFGNEKNFKSFPYSLQVLINEVLNGAIGLYKLPGLS